MSGVTAKAQELLVRRRHMGRYRRSDNDDHNGHGERSPTVG